MSSVRDHRIRGGRGRAISRGGAEPVQDGRFDYVLSGSLLGVELKGTVRPEDRGESPIAGFLREGKGLANQPEFTPQRISSADSSSSRVTANITAIRSKTNICAI